MYQHYNLFPEIAIYSLTGISICFALLFLVGSLIQKIRGQSISSFVKILLLGFSFAAFGLVMGMFIGLSKSPVVGTAFGPLMTFVGGICLYFFTKGNLQQLKGELLIPISVGVIFFSFSLLIGAEIGSASKSYQEHVMADRKFKYERAKELFQKKLEFADSVSVDLLFLKNRILVGHDRPLLFTSEKEVTIEELKHSIGH